MKRVLSKADDFDKIITETRDALRDFVISRGSFFRFDKDCCPSSIVTTEYGFAGGPDTIQEVDVIALMIDEDGDLSFYAGEMDPRLKFDMSDDELKKDTERWYALDWDCANAFEYNLARIVFHLQCFSDEYIEDHT